MIHSQSYLEENEKIEHMLRELKQKTNSDKNTFSFQAQTKTTLLRPTLSPFQLRFPRESGIRDSQTDERHLKQIERANITSVYAVPH